MTRLLLERGADREKRGIRSKSTEKWQTPLEIAEEERFENIAQLLRSDDFLSN